MAALTADGVRWAFQHLEAEAAIYSSHFMRAKTKRDFLALKMSTEGLVFTHNGTVLSASGGVAI